MRLAFVVQEKRSSYAPKEDEAPVRYDGIYRIRSCWRSKGAQGYLVCRYLFIRCDNAPAPWSSEGPRNRPLMHPDPCFSSFPDVRQHCGGLCDKQLQKQLLQ